MTGSWVGRVRRVAAAVALAALTLAFVQPDALAGFTDVRKISAGEYHTCALISDATVRCWGAAQYGQVGDGTTGDPSTHLRLTPTTVKRGSGALTGIKAISLGEAHSCALRDDRTVWCWGDDEFGQLGDGTTGAPSTHIRTKAVQVRRGSGFLTGITAISAGDNHTCARRKDGTAWCWGWASSGQVGDGSFGNASNLRVKAVRVKQGGGALGGITSVSAGRYHSCARRSDGTVWCWGLDQFGELGDGTTGGSAHMRNKAVQVRKGAGTLSGITSIGAGDDHTCARKSDGTVWCWGQDAYGAVGDGTTGDPTTHLRLKAVQVKQDGGFLTGVSSVDGGGSHSCARKSDGTAWCWGNDLYGELGDDSTGDPTTHLRLKAVQVHDGGGFLTSVASVSGGQIHTCAVRTNLTAWCWGDDASGQLGNGSDDPPHLVPVQVVFP